MNTPRTALASFLWLSILVACQGPGADSAAEPSPHELTPLVRVFDAKAREELSLDALWTRLGQADAVFLGETHIDEVTHRFELAVYEALIATSGRPVVLALEMFERDVQPWLDRYVAGEIDEAAFLQHARPWGNYRTGYRALLETARTHRLPVVASNPPVSVRNKVAMGGEKAFVALSDEERPLVARELHPNTAAYWQRFARAVRGHMGGPGAGDPAALLYSTQSLWDNTMGESCANALDAHANAIVVHVNGGFHSAHNDGTVAQLLTRRPQTKVMTLALVPVFDLAAVTGEGVRGTADYVVYAQSRARGLREGTLGVTIPGELQYRVFVPPHASDAKRVPLLLWLPDDGLRAADGEAFWRQALGEEVAIVALDPIYPELGRDLYEGARWYWDASFEEDLGRLTIGLARVRDYVLRYFPIDPARVVLAGEGTGATVVAAATLWEDAPEVPAIALAPRRYAKLREMGLPDPAAAPPQHGLVVFAAGDASDWWQREIADYEALGRKAELQAAPGDAFGRLAATELAIREALGLAPMVVPEDATSVLYCLEHDTPLARAWALRLARREASRTKVSVTTLAALAGLAPPAGKTELRPLWFGERTLPELSDSLSVGNARQASDLADGRALPLFPGPFGGSTLLVLPKGTDPAPWQELVQRDVIKKRSRFARLLLAFDADGNRLRDVLAGVQASRRRNVLIVPAAFCASAAEMDALREEAAPFADALDLRWLPGLGGRWDG